MKVSTVKEFRDKATKMLKSVEPVMITRRGKIAGFYIPADEQTLSLDLRKQLQTMLADALCKSLESQKLTEEDILNDFENSR